MPTQSTLTIRFANEEELAEWFQATRNLGALPPRSGVRHKDALDPGSRAGRGEYIVAADGAISGWLVAPEGQEPEENRVPVDPEEPLTHYCECGHQAYWHADQGEGEGSGACEHDADCSCQAFEPVADPSPVAA